MSTPSFSFVFAAWDKYPVETEGMRALKFEVVLSLALCSLLIALTIALACSFGLCEVVAGDVVVTLIPTLQPFALQGRGASTTKLTVRVRDMQLLITLLARSAIQS